MKHRWGSACIVERALNLGTISVQSVAQFQISLACAGSKCLTKPGGIRYFRGALDGVVAQLVEHHNGIVGVRGSSPLGSTILFCFSRNGEVARPVAALASKGSSLRLSSS